MKKIGLLTWHNYNNFGSALQSYALYKYINDNVAACRIINYNKQKFSIKRIIKSLVLLLPSDSLCNSSADCKFIKFRLKNIKQTKPVYNEKTLEKESKKFDILLSGSDQIWAPNVFNPVYMLNFSKNKKKVSYASSIGLNDIPKNLIKIYYSLLSDYSHISVREEQGVTLLKQKCNIDSTCVLDPTFLLSSNDWDCLQKDRKFKENYIFCYFLNKEHTYTETVLKYAKLMNLKIIAISARKYDNQWVDILDSCGGPIDFLNYIKYANLVITDSFHGIAFSIIYNKNFYVFERFKNNDIINQNSRIYNILKKLNLNTRILNVNTKEIVLENIDYSSVNKLLDKERKLSIDFINNSLT